MQLDIKNKIKRDFDSQSDEAIKLLELFELRNSLSPRVSRSIISLSKGNIDELLNRIREAESDWRDVVDEAETTTFEFNKPFESNNKNDCF